MLKHYFLIIVRNFKRYRNSFLINLIGLSTGIACTLFIAIWVFDEMAMDKYHVNDERIYQVMSNVETPAGIVTLEATPGLLSKAIVEQIPEVKSAVSVIPPSSFESRGILTFENTSVKGEGQVVGNEYFDIFSVEILQGRKEKPFKTNQDVLISSEMAMKLFNNINDAIGKTIAWDHEVLGGIYNIAGVFKKPDTNSTSHFDILFNYDLYFLQSPRSKSWGESDPHTYLLLNEGTDINTFQQKVKGFLKIQKADAKNILFVRKYSDRYLYGTYENGVQTGGRIIYIRLFSIIAVFILSIACINFMNLSTARASRRIKEVGIKKTVGATRQMLIFQYLSESVLMAFLSLIVGLIIVALLIPQFNEITAKHLTFHFETHHIILFLAIILFTGIVAGSYPALYLSGFDPATVLKGKLNASVGEIWIRRGLVVFQFAMSVILIVSVLVVYKQIDFVQSRGLGLSKDNIIYFKKEGKIGPGFEPFLQEVENLSGVSNVSYMWGNFTGGVYETEGVKWEGMANKLSFKFQQVGGNLIETFNMELKEGRSFSKELTSEQSKIIFNEAAIEAMGLNQPVGRIVNLWGDNKEIIGVVKNFHFESLYEKVKPFFFVYEPYPDRVLVKIKPGMEKETIAQIDMVYKKHFAGISFDYKFLDNDYKLMYASEKRVADLSFYFAIVAILISCLGLFGLAEFMAERRTKEITIRKILGSSELKILLMLSGDFTKMVLASIVIALPVSYYISSKWLDSFQYRITLGAWIFITSAFITLMIAWLAVGYQLVKASRIKMVDALKFSE